MHTDNTHKKEEAGKKERDRSGKQPSGEKEGTAHVGSSNAFEETEDPRSSDPDGITDEKLDEWLGE